MNQSRRDVNQQQITWRREKVLDLSSKGLTERDIAGTLNISQPTIHRDLRILKQKAKQNITNYIDEQLPAEYEQCLIGITAIMKESWKTAASAESKGDRRDKLQALTLAKECYAMKLDLLTSATVVDRAIKFVEYRRGLMPQSTELVIHGPAEPIANP